MSDLRSRLLKNSTVSHTAVISESKFFTSKSVTKTDLPILNIAFSGKPSGGFSSGLIQIAGESRTFKSNLGLFCVRSYLKNNKDAVCVFLDSEHGTPPAYLSAFGIDLEQVIHVPLLHVEMLKFELVKQLDGLTRGDKVIFFIDSIGNLASRKELDDALDEKAVADMSRAKQIKSLWRIVTPLLTEKDVTCIAINHTYKTMEMYAKDIVGGGTGNMYSSDTVFIVTRAQEKDATGLTGYKFTINIEKSRYIREKSKFPFIANFETGIDRWSGLLDLAVEFGVVVKPSNGWYTRPTIIDDKKWRAADTNCVEFWKPIFNDTNFVDCISDKYRVGETQLITVDDDLDLQKLV